MVVPQFLQKESPYTSVAPHLLQNPLVGAVDTAWYGGAIGGAYGVAIGGAYGGVIGELYGGAIGEVITIKFHQSLKQRDTYLEQRLDPVVVPAR
jgi:outer membrane lipoprotein SlyB